MSLVEINPDCVAKLLQLILVLSSLVFQFLLLLSGLHLAVRPLCFCSRSLLGAVDFDPLVMSLTDVFQFFQLSQYFCHQLHTRLTPVAQHTSSSFLFQFSVCPEALIDFPFFPQVQNVFPFSNKQ